MFLSRSYFYGEFRIMFDLISLLWLPIVIILAALSIGGLAWFFFVRSIDIPWDDRQKK